MPLRWLCVDTYLRGLTLDDTLANVRSEFGARDEDMVECGKFDTVACVRRA